MNNTFEKPTDSKEAMIKQILGQEADYKKYEKIVEELKRLCESKKYRNFIFAEIKDEGFDLTNAQMPEDVTADQSDYEEAFVKWSEFLKDNGLEGKQANGLAELLYCMGETDLAKRIDFGEGPEVQENPEGKLVCRFPKV